MSFKIQCKQCGKEFKIIESRRNRAAFCGMACKAMHQRNKSRSCESNKKSSETARKNHKLGLNNLGWSKNLTKKTDKRIAKMARAVSARLKEQYANGERRIFSKGLTKETHPSIMKMAVKIKEQFKNGRKVWVLEKRGYTSIEKMFYKALDNQEIKYTPQKQIFIHNKIHTYPDAFIAPNICLYFDGNYWHAGRQHYIDIWQVKTLTKLGFKVLRFKEDRIRDDLKNCIEEVLKTIPREVVIDPLTTTRSTPIIIG